MLRLRSDPVSRVVKLAFDELATDAEIGYAPIAAEDFWPEGKDHGKPFYNKKVERAIFLVQSNLSVREKALVIEAIGCSDLAMEALSRHPLEGWENPAQLANAAFTRCLAAALCRHVTQ